MLLGSRCYLTRQWLPIPNFGLSPSKPPLLPSRSRRSQHLFATSLELESVVAAQAREPNGGLVVMPDSFTDAHSVEITSLAARYRLPTVFAYRFFTCLAA